MERRLEGFLSRVDQASAAGGQVVKRARTVIQCHRSPLSQVWSGVSTVLTWLLKEFTEHFAVTRCADIVQKVHSFNSHSREVDADLVIFNNDAREFFLTPSAQEIRWGFQILCDFARTRLGLERAAAPASLMETIPAIQKSNSAQSDHFPRTRDFHQARGVKESLALFSLITHDVCARTLQELHEEWARTIAFLHSYVTIAAMEATGQASLQTGDSEGSKI